MPTVYQPNDTLISPIVAAIANIVSTQVSGVTVVHQQPPDGPPEDGSVVLPLSQYKILDDTNGRLKLKLTFAVKHFVVRGSYPENILAAYSYVVPYFQAFNQWSNQQLGGLCQELTLTNGGVTQFVQAGQVFVCLVLNLDVVLDFLIPTN